MDREDQGIAASATMEVGRLLGADPERREEGARRLRQAIHLDPQDIGKVAQVHLGVLLVAADSTRQEGERLLRQATRFEHPEAQPRGLLELGRHLDRHGDVRAAEQLLSEAMVPP